MHSRKQSCGFERVNQKHTVCLEANGSFTPPPSYPWESGVAPVEDSLDPWAVFLLPCRPRLDISNMAFNLFIHSFHKYLREHQWCAKHSLVIL